MTGVTVALSGERPVELRVELLVALSGELCGDPLVAFVAPPTTVAAAVVAPAAVTAARPVSVAPFVPMAGAKCARCGVGP